MNKMRCGWIVILWMLSSASVFSERIPVGEVVLLRGTVRAVDEAGESRVLELHSTLYANDRTITERGALLRILFLDDSVISQGEHSEMVIDSYVYDPARARKSNALFRFINGLFRVSTGVITEKTPGNFKVKTGRSTIGIRGCELIFDISKRRERIFVVGLPKGHSVVVETGASGGRAAQEVEIRQAGTCADVEAGRGLVRRRYDEAELRPLERAVEPEQPADDVLNQQPPMLPIMMTCSNRPVTVEAAEEVLQEYKSVPGGVTLEGIAQGFGPFRQVSYSWADHSFRLGDGTRYPAPLPRADMKEIIRAIDQDEQLGVSLAGEYIVYGKLNPEGELAMTLCLADKLLGSIVFGESSGAEFENYRLAEGFEPLRPARQQSGVCVYFQFDGYRFGREHGDYRLEASNLDVMLIPVENGARAADGGALPDFAAIRRGAVPAAYQHNADHLRAHISYYMRERMLRQVRAYGEVAAFARLLKQRGISLRILAASM